VEVHVSGVAVVVLHDDPTVLREIVGAVDASEDLYVAGTDLADPAGVIVAGGRALEDLRDPTPAPLIALAERGAEVRAARRALAVGARDIVHWPDEALRLAGAARLAAATRAGRRAATVTAVVGARGGVGTSVTVLAFAIASTGIAVDHPAGSLDLLAENEDAVHPGAPVALDRALVALPQGARLLPADRLPGDRDAAITAVRTLASDVIVDAGRGGLAVSSVDRWVIAAANDLASVRGIRSLIASGVRPDALLVRRERRDGVALRDLAAIAGEIPCVAIPMDARLGRCLDLGRWPTRPTRALRALADAWRTLPS
jgi:hypothetical protein